MFTFKSVLIKISNMKDLPLPIVISVLIKDNKILLIKRIKKGDYVGLLGMPGGKIEKNEHVSDAAIREMLEESGIKSKFKSYLGFVSEHLIEGEKIIQHFLLHICELEPQTTEILNNPEGELNWFDLDKLNTIKNQIIPSDYLMIEKIIKPHPRAGKRKEKLYYDCILEKIGDKHIIKKFE